MPKDITRKCIVTGEVLDKGQLLRFVKAPDGRIVPDFKKKLPGKGVYVVNAKTALEKAIKANLFAKALKEKARVPKRLWKKQSRLICLPRL